MLEQPGGVNGFSTCNCSIGKSLHWGWAEWSPSVVSGMLE